MADPTLIQVGDFQLYPTERQLLASGRPVEVGARAFDLLLVLVENAGKLVTKATLIERVWRRVIVDENNLPAQVASLRRVLGAGAIRTVPGFGYRLELNVTQGGGAAQAVAAGSLPAAAPAAGAVRLTPPRRVWHGRLNALIGREAELGAVRTLLAQHTLVSLIGMAGVGKTRLAQEILALEAQTPDATVAWVALPPHRDWPQCAAAIAVALGLPVPDGVDSFGAIRHALEQAQVLLILDSAEHLVDELAEPLGALLDQSANVRALVTSQRPLGIPGEQVFRLGPLPIPQPGTLMEHLGTYPAVALFEQRVRAVDQRFVMSGNHAELVAEICRQLDGNPLALELAAARVPTLGLSALLERLSDRLRLLRLGRRAADPRHETLYTAFDWSYGLLNAAEREVFDRLGVFAGSFTLPTAAASVADEHTDRSDAVDIIGRLADRSLVTVLPTEPPRYVLPETARQYARARLAAGGRAEAVRGRFGATLLELLDTGYREYWSLDEAIWLHRYASEIANVRAALEWAIGADAVLAVSLYGSAWPLYIEMDLYAEGRADYARILPLLNDSTPLPRLARFWEAITAYDSSRNCDRARYAAELAARMYDGCSDLRSRYFALLQLAYNWRDDGAAARSAFEQARALEDAAWPPRLLAYRAVTEGAMQVSAGQFAEARRTYQKAVRLALTTSERQALTTSINIVELDIACGDYEGAVQLGHPLATSLRQLGLREAHLELLCLTCMALLLNGDLQAGRHAAAELHASCRGPDLGRLHGVLDAMALLAGQDGRPTDAVRILQCADAQLAAQGLPQRRPGQKRVRAALETLLNQELAGAWADTRAAPDFDARSACALALGLAAAP